MNTIFQDNEPFNERQLIQTLKTAINTSKKTLMNDGILLICWGIALSLGFLWGFLNSKVLVPSRIQDIMTLFKPVTGILLIAFTIYYLFFRKPKVSTFTAISTRFVWIGVIVAHNLNVIVTKTFLNEVNFDILHPLQMVLIGFALFVTGGIYRYYILSVSGVIMWIGAAVAANYDLNTQFLIRGISDALCFVVPGILMYLSSKKQLHV